MKVLGWSQYAKELGALYITQYKNMWKLPSFPFTATVQGDTIVFTNTLGKIERVSIDYFKISN